MDANDRTARVLVGRKGSGKTLYLRRLQTAARAENALYADDWRTDLPPTSEIVRVFDWASDRQDAVERWERIWKRAIQRATMSHLQYHPELAKSVGNHLLSLRGYEGVLFAPFDAPVSIYSQVSAIVNEHWDLQTRHRNPGVLDHYLAQPEWPGFQHHLYEALRAVKPLCFYLDGADEPEQRPTSASELLAEIQEAFEARSSKPSGAGLGARDTDEVARSEPRNPSHAILDADGRSIEIAFEPVPPDRPVFEISRNLITRRIFSAFIAEHPEWGPHRLRRDLADRTYLAGWDAELSSEYGDLPVAFVSYCATVACLAWLSERVEGQLLRLPSEEEWEVAAQAGRTGQWWQEDSAAGIVACAGMARHRVPVGSRGVNPWGIADLLGNVQDMCAGPEGVVGRGGSWRTRAADISKERLSLSKTDCRADVGFRCLREIGGRSPG